MSKSSRIAGRAGIVFFVMYSVWLLAWHQDLYFGTAVSSVLHTLTASCAAVTLFLAFRQSDGAKYWFYYALGLACYALAQLYWTMDLLISGGVPGSFGPAEVIWIIQYGCYILALFHQNRNRQESSVPYMLDILLFLSVSVTVYWQLYIHPALAEQDLPEVTIGFYLFCSSINLVILLALLILITLERNRVSKGPTLLLGFGFFAKTIGNSIALFMTNGAQETGIWSQIADFCWLAGVLSIGFSGFFVGKTIKDYPAAESKYRGFKRYIPLAVGGFLLVFLHAASYPLSPVALGSLLGVALLTARLFAGIRHTEKMNRSLRETNLTYRSWADNALVGVFIEQDGRLVYVNGYCEELFGYERGRMTGHTILNHIAFPDIPRFMSEIEKLHENLPTNRFEATGVTRDQSNFYLEMHLSSTYYLGREALCGTLIDITERKMSEQYLIRSEKLSVVGQLAAGVAHEIRNPLTALKGFTQLLHRNSDGNRQYYEIMLTELERINYIVGEFMVLSKPHNRQQLKEQDIHRILISIIPILESQAILHNVIIRVETSDDLPPVKCDENQIKQVLINLMKNAIEAMPGGGTVTVRYEIDEAKRELIVYIEDQGGGMPPDLLLRLGEPFLTTKEKGTGLGLMVCFKIIQAHEGVLSVNSQPGQGTSVKIVLPAR